MRWVAIAAVAAVAGCGDPRRCRAAARNRGLDGSDPGCERRLLVGGDKAEIAYDVTQTPVRELWRHPVSNADSVATVRLGIDRMIVVSTADSGVAAGSVRVFE